MMFHVPFTAIIVATLIALGPAPSTVACELRCRCVGAATLGMSDAELTRQHRDRATAVYRGRVVRIDAERIPFTNQVRTQPYPAPGTAYLEVEAVWKGAVGDTAILALDRSSSCSWWLDEGKRYIIFAYAGRDGKLHISQCSGTVPAERGDSTMLALGAPLRATAP